MNYDPKSVRISIDDKELKGYPIRSDGGGLMLSLGDVAKVTDGHGGEVLQQPGETVEEFAARAEAYFASIRPSARK